MKYQAVLFDFDYTLGDATEAIYAGFCHAMKEMGRPAPDREAVRRTVGMVVADGYTLLTGDGSPEGRERFYSLFHPVSRDLQARGMVKLFPGAAELLRGLKTAGIPAAVVSSKNMDTLGTVLIQNGLADCLACIVGGGTVSRPKPDPEGVLWVLDQLGLEPSRALYCGDTVIDAQTAQNAGADFCAVLNGTTPAADFGAYPCARIAPDLWDLKDWLGV